MVDSKKAGVIFTVNPVNKKDTEIIIEAAFGLGETVVSGQVTPDNYVIDKVNNDILNKYVNEQDWGLFRNEEGKNYRKDVENPEEQVLTDEEIKQLAEIAIKIENHYGKPQDIEFAIDDKIYIVQSRPITTL